MPTYETLPRFTTDLDRLTPEQRRRCRQTVAAFVDDLRARAFRAGLRVKVYGARPESSSHSRAARTTAPRCPSRCAPSVPAHRTRRALRAAGPCINMPGDELHRLARQLESAPGNRPYCVENFSSTATSVA
ncbi:hypothetical protein GCM10020295_00800 [Streptomyces cinereospinus]